MCEKEYHTYVRHIENRKSSWFGKNHFNEYKANLSLF